MWDTAWIDAHLATMAGDTPYGLVEDGAIGVADGRIVWVGPMAALPNAPGQLAREVISASGRWITPGLIDCHTHLVFGGDRTRDFELRLAGASREQIAAAGGGLMSTVAATRVTPTDELFDRASRRLQCLLAEGVTTIEIKSGYGLDLETELRLLRVARELGRRYPITVCPTFGAYAVAPEFSGREDDYVAFLCETMLPAVARERLAAAVDVQIDELGFSHAQAAAIFEAAHRLGFAVKAHTDELSDFDGTALATRHRALSADHLEYLSAENVAAMRRAGTVAVLLPGNTFMLRLSQIPPVEQFREHGVPMAVATNCNPGTSPVTSILLVLTMSCTLFRMTPEEALAGVTCNAAAALGLAATHGTLEPGKVADFVLWDIEHPAELASRLGFNPCATIVQAGLPRGDATR